MEEPAYPAEEPELKRRLMGYSPEDVQNLLADREQMLAMASESAKNAEARIADLERELEAMRAEMPRPDYVEDRERMLAEVQAQLEQAQDELTRSRVEVEQARGSLSDEERRRQAAEDRAEQHVAELDELRQDLLIARRDLVNESERAHMAESRIEELTSELEASLARIEIAPPAISDPSTADEVADVLRAAEEVVARVMEGGRARAQQELEGIHRELQEAQRARDEVRIEIEHLGHWRDRLAPQVEVVRSAIEDAQLHAMRFGERIQEAVHPITAAMQVLGEQLEELTEIGAMGPQGDPEAGASSPEAGASSPEAGASSPEAGASSPEAGASSPEAGASRGPELHDDNGVPTTQASAGPPPLESDPGGSPGRPLTEVPSS